MVVGVIIVLFECIMFEKMFVMLKMIELYSEMCSRFWVRFIIFVLVVN